MKSLRNIPEDISVSMYPLSLFARGSFEESMFLLCFEVLDVQDESCFKFSVPCIIFIYFFCYSLIGFWASFSS